MSGEMMMLQRFPPLFSETKNIIKAADFGVMIYDRKGGSVYCTACGLHFAADRISFRHGQKDYCPECGKLCEMVSNHYKWDPLVRRHERNFAVVLPADNEQPDPLKRNCYITVVKVTLHYVQGMCEPVCNVEEHQRYIFTPDGRSLRFGRCVEWFNDGRKWYREITDWKCMSRFEDPVFDGKCSEGYGIYNIDALMESCMRHSAAELIEFSSGRYYNDISLLAYLRFYNRHRGAERLIKAGLQRIVKAEMHRRSRYIDWNQTEPHRMLGLTRPEVKQVAEGKLDFYERRWLMELMPDRSPAQLDKYSGVVSSYYRERISKMIQRSGIPAVDVFRYLGKSSMQGHTSEYCDYIGQCRELGYDFANRQVAFPRDLRAAHQRATAAINALRREQEVARLKELEKQYAKLRRKRRKLEFSAGDLFIRQPENAAEIIAEGEALSHCVGGYAERHMTGELAIMFLRKRSDPDTPYYTIEVSKDNRLIQCREYKNNWVENGGKPKEQEIIDFEELYEQHLDRISGRIKEKTEKGA